ncbi:hypothetical protein BI081_gp020 [Mycobacterium phage Tonenili]|uniref:Phage ABA sandwich domain-containing protein n=1 Tax=Mycobacterium phage Tonenili TaxID=1891703 RepID=A0A1C9EH06_9CAUD|nr:hypothetical protein BI081_gp020 [Mycobacterium phage Tonenili]AON96771.1 hypothetical protein SEA_TONENILI_20 [Mycobacterium phage Tonenili]
MMSDELRAVLTEALVDELSGWTIGDGYYKSQVPFHEAREMADTLVGILLSLPGVAVIQLPKPDELRYGWCLQVEPSGIIRDLGPMDSYTAEDARGFAGALVAAAAVVAEGEDK